MIRVIYGLYMVYIWVIYGLSTNMGRIRCGVAGNVGAQQTPHTKAVLECFGVGCDCL